MKSNNVYIKYDTFNSSEDIYEFIDSSKNLLSNHKNYLKEINQLVSHKEKIKKNYKKRENGKKQYANIYAHRLTILIPKEIENDKKDEFLKRTLRYIVPGIEQYKIPYVYRYLQLGEGTYVDVMIFTSYATSPKLVAKTYKRDGYYNQTTGKLCKADDPNAVLKYRKGDEIRNAKGEVVGEVLDVIGVKSAKASFKWKKGFKNTMEKFKKLIIKALEEILHNVFIYSIISRKTIKHDNYTKSYIKYLLTVNSNIKEINIILRKIQDSIIHMKLEDTNKGIKRSFNNILLKVDKFIHEKKNPNFEELRAVIEKWWKRQIEF